MARRALHSTDDILDAARTLLLRAGIESATVQAIAAESGAPVGSLYNRFASRGALLAQLWIRAAQRSQAACLPALDLTEPLDAAIEGALSLVRFTRKEPDDARLLASHRRDELVTAADSPATEHALRTLNEPVEAALKQLSRRLFGDARAEHVARVGLAVVDVPLGAVQRYLVAGQRVPAALDLYVARAVRAILTEE